MRRAQNLEAAWSTEVAWRLQRFGPHLQGTPWFRSLQGRQHLWAALRAREPRERSVELAFAKKCLEDATREDRNPIAMLALARTLEEMSPTQSDKRSEELQRAADLAVDVTAILASAALRSWRREQDPFTPILFITGPAYASYLVRNQPWCWPTDPEIQHRLRAALFSPSQE